MTNIHVFDIIGIISILILLAFLITYYASFKREQINKKDINLPRNVYKYINLSRIASCDNIDIYMDENTRVMYFAIDLFKDGAYSISPIYNADGSIKLFDDTYEFKAKEIYLEDEDD